MVPSPTQDRPAQADSDLRSLGAVVLLVALATGAGFVVIRYLVLADVMMLYMLCITVAATQFDRKMTLVASILSILALDFCFIEPRYTFVLTDIQHAGTFAVMMGVGWVIMRLTERIRAQTRVAQEQARHSRALYRLGAVLAEGGSATALQERVETYLGRELEGPLAILLCDGRGELGDRASLPPEEMGVARQVMARQTPAGPGFEPAPSSTWALVPMTGMERVVGMLAFLPPPGAAESLGLLVPLAAQISLALERATLAEERTEARIRAEHEHMRSTLLSSISHDLRTPLGTITGATSTLLDPGPEARPGDQKVLLGTIHDESARLLRMVNNLLDITRLELGQVNVRREWVAIEEVVGSAIHHLEEALGARPLSVDLPEIWIPIDPVLFEQAVINLLDNALKFSPAGTAIGIRAAVEGNAFRLEVTDQGPGIPAGEEERIFEKLFRGSGGGSAPGAGLGLAICKGIAQVHGGNIKARTRAQGGAVVITLPMDPIPSDSPSPDLPS
jgi:two-component system sensor histidine kinase KdpD